MATRRAGRYNMIKAPRKRTAMAIFIGDTRDTRDDGSYRQRIIQEWDVPVWIGCDSIPGSSHWTKDFLNCSLIVCQSGLGWNDFLNSHGPYA